MTEDGLTQEEVLRRLSSLLLHIGNNQPPLDSPCDLEWWEGILSGIAMSCGVAAGAGTHADISVSSLASMGLDVAKAVDWVNDPDDG